jgi:hypothetical protein
MAGDMGFEVPVGLVHNLPDAIEIRQTIRQSGDILRMYRGIAQQQA